MESGYLKNEKYNRTLTFEDFEDLFKESLSDFVKQKICEYTLEYFDITDVERDACIKKIVAELLDNNLVKAGEHRFEQWEMGWRKNLNNVIERAFENDVEKMFDKPLLPNHF